MLFIPSTDIAASFYDAVGHMLEDAPDSSRGDRYVFKGTNVTGSDVLVHMAHDFSILEIEARFPAMSVEQLDAVEAWRIENFGSAHERMALTAEENSK